MRWRWILRGSRWRWSRWRDTSTRSGRSSCFRCWATHFRRSGARTRACWPTVGRTGRTAGGVGSWTSCSERNRHFRTGNADDVRRGATMAKSKRKPESPFTGRWRITSMSAWDNDYLDEEEPAYIEFKAKDGGEFHFGYVHGS